MAQTPLGRYQFAEVGEESWHRDEGPENVWEKQEIEIIWYGSQSNRPSAEVNGRKYFGIDSRILWYDDGDSWSPIAGLGSENNFIPTKAHIDGVRINDTPAAPNDAVRKTDLDALEDALTSQIGGFASDPHGDDAHTESYYKSGDNASLGDVDASSVEASRVRVDVLEFNPLSSNPSNPRDASMWFVED